MNCRKIVCGLVATMLLGGCADPAGTEMIMSSLPPQVTQSVMSAIMPKTAQQQQSAGNCDPTSGQCQAPGSGQPGQPPPDDGAPPPQDGGPVAGAPDAPPQQQ